MRAPRIGFFTLAAVALVAALPGRSMATSMLIEPGQAIGPARLGMSVSEARTVLGKMDEQDGEMLVRRWDMTVTFRSGTVARVSSTSAAFRTYRGAGVGTPLDEVATLVGDQNRVSTRQGDTLTVLFPFQGIGFVFRGQRAASVFVEKPISLTSPAAPSAAAAAQAHAAGTAGQSAPVLRLESLTEVVDPGRALLTITGRVANAGGTAVPAHIGGQFVDSSDHETRSQALVQQPIPPGGDAPFTLTTSLAQGIVLRYTVTAIALGTSGAHGDATRVVPPATYNALAQATLKVAVQIGAPSNTAAKVQVLVSIIDTRPIPRAWVREVEVVVGYTGGQQTVLVPGDRAVTVLIPAGAALGATTVQAVTLQAP